MSDTSLPPEQPEPEATVLREVNPEMIILARESRGFSQEQLADILHVTQGKVSKYEAGMLVVSDADLERMSIALQYPIGFFTQTEPLYGFGASCLYHRKRKSLPIKELKVIHAKINIIRLHLKILLRAVEVDSRNSIQPMDVDQYESPEAIAQMTRYLWRLPLGPVRNLVNAVENAGGIVFECSFGTDKLDAASQWPREMPPLFFVNKDIPVDRWRFSLAHELAHLVMHALPGPDAESEADRFASEFLMPKQEIAHELEGLSLAKSVQLKTHWRVSMQALIRRAKDIGKISERHYKSLCIQISQEGYRKEEPVTLSPEKPTVVRDLLDVYQKSFDYDIPQLSRYVHSTERHFRELFLGELPGRRPA